MNRQERFDGSGGEVTGYEGLADEQFWAELVDVPCLR
jgi:hypothetical protein